MSIRITHVRLAPGYNDHEHIVRYRWVGIESGSSGESDKPALVAWLEEASGNRAFVGSGNQKVEVGVVHPSYGQPYVRTYADNVWTNNLLSLDRF
ncbi:hypothetical protein ASE38_00280 [Cellulomonas sp. Root930]|nr:hypothetical protein ASE38_00280 [Cellulomonas sp. Root930]